MLRHLHHAPQLSLVAGGFKKSFWVLVMMGMAAVLIYNVVGLTTKYLGNPISVKLSVDHQQRLMFPAVAVCNMSPIKKSSLLAAQNAAVSVKRRRKRSAGIGNHMHVMYLQGLFLL